MSIRDIVRKVPTATKSMSISDVVRLMASTDSDVVVVLDKDNTVYGVVTPRDIVRAIAKGVDLSSTIDGIASKDFLIITERASIWDVMRLLENNRVQFIVVLSEDGKVKGVITLNDIVRLNGLLSAALSMMPHFESYAKSKI